MADKCVVNKSTLTGIADAIRTKGGTTANLLPSAMAQAINDLPSGGGGVDGHELLITVYGDSGNSSGRDFTVYYADGTTKKMSVGKEVRRSYINESNVVGVSVTPKKESGSDSWDGISLGTTKVDRFIVEDTISSIYLQSYGCLIAGTMILLADGTSKNVEDITYDDELMCWDFKNGRLSSAFPDWIRKEQTAEYAFESLFDDGTSLWTTGESGHRCFDVDKGSFVYNTELGNDSVYKIDGSKPKHVSVERKEGEYLFYNIITHTHMNLFANGVLTSCRFNNVYPIEGMKFVKDGREFRSEDEFLYCPPQLAATLKLREQTMSWDDIHTYVKDKLLANMTPLLDAQ